LCPNASTEVKSFIDKLEIKIKTCAISSGVESALNLLKTSSSSYRDKWMKGLTPKTLFHIKVPQILRNEDFCAQFSFVGRSLPPGSLSTAKKAIEKHKKDLGTGWDTPPHLIEGVKRFSFNWARQHIPRGKDRLAIISMSSSACYTYNRKEGGLARWVRESLESAPELLTDRPPGILDQEWADLVSEQRLLAFCKRDLNNPDLRKAKVEVIKEPGLKARIVTKSHGTVLTLGHLARRRLMYGLNRTKGLSSVLSGDHLKALNLRNGGEVNSSDLTSATDLFPFDLVDSLVQGLIDSDRFREEEICGLKLCTGSMEIQYSDSCLHSKKGILMGLPTTWSLLCLVHLFWIDHAQRTSSGKLSLSRRLSYSICGDDAIIIGGAISLNRYDSVIRDCGGILSKGKHFRSSLGRGVFLEILVSYIGPLLQHWQLQRLGYMPHEKIRLFNSHTVHEAISLRALVAPTAGLHLGGQQVIEVGLPTEIAAGAIVDSLVGAGCNHVRIWAVQQTLYGPCIDRMRKAGVSVMVPRCLGGAGFITRKGWNSRITSVAPLSLRKGIAVLLSNRSPTLGPGTFNRLWKKNSGSLANRLAEEDAETLLLRVKHSVKNSTPKPSVLTNIPWYYCGTIDEFIEGNEAIARRRLALLLPDDSGDRPDLGPGAYGKRIRSALRKLLDLWPGVKPIKGLVCNLVIRQRNLEASTSVWLPGTEDPLYPGVFGLPWLSGHGSRSGLRERAALSIGFPD
jgi:hypothetical protein